MKLECWFPTPIWYTLFEGITDDQYNAALEYCLERSQKEESVVYSNKGGWQSRPSSYVQAIYTPLKPFLIQLEEYLKHAFIDIGINTPKPVSSVWINVNSKNSYNNLHLHTQASLSGVFYLTDNNAKITFERNQDASSYHLDWMGAATDTPLSYRGVDYVPLKGQLIIFPSWLQHSVSPNTNESPRVSIAFNCSYQ
jgi:uncharacterized protein (TIGR02466 family)